MCRLKVRFSQSSQRRGVFNYALKVEVTDATGIPSKIFVYHQSPAGVEGNTFAEFDHIATPVDFQEIPEDAASETVPWYRTDKCTVWFRNVSDLVLAKQLFVDDINALMRTYNVLTSENGFRRQTSVEFSENGVHEAYSDDEDTIQKEIDAMKKDISGKVSKDAMSGVRVETNTPEGIRNAVREIGNTLGAKIVKTVVIALSVLSIGASALGAGFSGEHFAQIDLDENPVIVTNVTFDGLATLVDITNIIDSISTNFVPALRKEIADASKAGTNYVDSATNDVLSAAGDYTDSRVNNVSNELARTIQPLLDIPELIPVEAAPTNQLADKNYVNSATSNVLSAAQGYTDEKISETYTKSETDNLLHGKRSYDDLTLILGTGGTLPVRVGIGRPYVRVVDENTGKETDYALFWNDEHGCWRWQGYSPQYRIEITPVSGGPVGRYELNVALGSPTIPVSLTLFYNRAVGVHYDSRYTVYVKISNNYILTTRDKLKISSLSSPNGETIVEAKDDGTATITVSGDYEEPVVIFEDGFSISYGGGEGEQTYTAPSGGETITFVGPVPSSNPDPESTAPLYYYPSSLGELDSFDPNDYDVWCLTDFGGSSWHMMYKTGPYYDVGTLDSTSPSLTLAMGEATGDGPTMSRVRGDATTEPLATEGMVEAKLDKADVVTPSASATPGQAADAKATGEALSGKASTADATLTPVYDGNGKKFSDWVCVPPVYEGSLITIVETPGEEAGMANYTPYSNGAAIGRTGAAAEDILSLRWRQGAASLIDLTATRTANKFLGYQLGDQDDKPLQPAGDYVPVSRTVNGKALTNDVTLTGADIAVSGTDATKIDAALAGKASKSDVDSLLFAQYYPEGSVKSAAEFTPNIKYDDPDTVNRTITVKPFCDTGTAANDNSGLVGRVVIPPFVDAQGNPYITDDGTRYKVVGVSDAISHGDTRNLTAIVAPTTVTSVGGYAFAGCSSLTAVSLPAATSINDYVFAGCNALASVDFGDTPRQSVPTLGEGTFNGVSTTDCTIIVPYTQYDAWKAASGWRDLQQEFVRHAEKADKPVTFTTGNLAALDANGNPTDSTIPATNVVTRAMIDANNATFSNAVLSVGLGIDTNTVAAINELVEQGNKLPVGGATTVGALLLALASAIAMLKRKKANSTAVASEFSTSSTYAVGDIVMHDGLRYKCTTAVTTAGAWTGLTNWTTATVEDVLAALRTGKADKPTTFTTGNLAALDSDGNPTDSRKKARDFATAAQGTKADTAIQGVKVNGTEITPDAQKKVNLEVATEEDVTLTDNAWQCMPAELIDPLTSRNLSVEVRYEDNAWELLVVGGSGDPIATVTPGDPDARSLEFNFVWNNEPTTVTATRAYQLGDQSDKLLQPAGDYVPSSRTVNGNALTNDVTLTGADIPVDATQGAQKINAALAGKASKSDVDPLLFAQYYPEGNIKSAAEFTPGIQYDAPDTTHRTVMVKPFCNINGTAANDNSSLVGRVVIPPFVDAQGNPYISDDGTRFKVVGVSGGSLGYSNTNLTAIVAPNTVTTIGSSAFIYCPSLTSVSLPAAMTVGASAFQSCTSLAFVSLPAATSIWGNSFSGCTSLDSVSLPAVTTIGNYAFENCTSLVAVSLPAATSIGDEAFDGCTSLASVDFGDTPRPSVPTLYNTYVFNGVPATCKIIVPYTQYDAWIAATGWKDLPQEFVRHAEKADKPATFTTGNLAALDAQGNPVDAGYHFEVRNGIPCIVQYT